MSNIYIYFETEAERRDFTQKIIVFSYEILKKGRHVKNIPAKMQKNIDLMETSKTDSPYFNLYKQFYRGKLPELEKALPFYHPYEVFKNGFRSIYYMNSYMHRPGKWLVIQLRNTADAKNIDNFISENISEDRLGLNVSAAGKDTYIIKLKNVILLLEHLEADTLKEIEASKRCEMLDTIYNCLIEIDNAAPELFKDEKLYLWERSAFVFFTQHMMDKMESCLRYLSKFQPGSADAFITMGDLYHQNGDIVKAIECYREGLKIDAESEYIYFKISFLLNKLGDTKNALIFAKSSLLQNPNSELNYILLGDIYLNSNELGKAITFYKNALRLTNERTDASIITGCREKIKACYLELGLEKEVNNVRYL